MKFDGGTLSLFCIVKSLSFKSVDARFYLIAFCTSLMMCFSCVVNDFIVLILECMPYQFLLWFHFSGLTEKHMELTGSMEIYSEEGRC